jgi:homopolymeric O-antigen transport system permease protein
MEAWSSATPRVIEPAGGRLFPSLSEIRRHADLIYFLSRREVAARYKQSVVGVFWVILQPLLLAVVFSVFFGVVAKVPSQPGVPYPVFAVSGMVLWLFFSTAMSTASESTVANEALISKVYFPRVVIPIAAVIPPAVDFALGFVVVIGAMLVYGVIPEIQMVLMPLLVALTLATALGFALWLSALNVRYRDIHLLIPFLILVGLFVSPITYPISLIPDGLQPVYAINPVVGLFEAYRWMLFGTSVSSAIVILIPVLISLALLISGAAYFERAQRDFADVI